MRPRSSFRRNALCALSLAILVVQALTTSALARTESGARDLQSSSIASSAARSFASLRLRDWTKPFPSTGSFQASSLVRQLRPELPPCTPEQLALSGPSDVCQKSLFAPNGTGTCPGNCCCDLQTLRNGTIRVFISSDGCEIEGHVSEDIRLIAVYVLPFTIEPPMPGDSSDRCANRIPGQCAELLGDGCAFPDELIPQLSGDDEEDSDDAEDSSDAEDSNQKSESEEESDSGGSSSSRTTTIALATCLSVLAVLLVISVGVFIVRPALARRSAGLDESDFGQDDLLPGDAGSSSRPRAGEIDEELMALDAAVSGESSHAEGASQQPDISRSHSRQVAVDPYQHGNQPPQ